MSMTNRTRNSHQFLNSGQVFYNGCHEKTKLTGNRDIFQQLLHGVSQRSIPCFIFISISFNVLWIFQNQFGLFDVLAIAAPFFIMFIMACVLWQIVTIMARAKRGSLQQYLPRGFQIVLSEMRNKWKAS